MTSGNPRSSRSFPGARWASLFALCAAALLSACGNDDTTPPGNNTRITRENTNTLCSNGRDDEPTS